MASEGDHWTAKALQILSAPTSDLTELARIAGYDPKTFYRGADFRAADLTDEDLDAFDLSGADLSRATIDPITATLRRVERRQRALDGEIPGTVGFALMTLILGEAQLDRAIALGARGPSSEAAAERHAASLDAVQTLLEANRLLREQDAHPSHHQAVLRAGEASILHFRYEQSLAVDDDADRVQRRSRIYFLNYFLQTARKALRKALTEHWDPDDPENIADTARETAARQHEILAEIDLTTSRVAGASSQRAPLHRAIDHLETSVSLTDDGETADRCRRRLLLNEARVGLARQQELGAMAAIAAEALNALVAETRRGRSNEAGDAILAEVILAEAGAVLAVGQLDANLTSLRHGVDLIATALAEATGLELKEADARSGSEEDGHDSIGRLSYAWRWTRIRPTDADGAETETRAGELALRHAEYRDLPKNAPFVTRIQMITDILRGSHKLLDACGEGRLAGRLLNILDDMRTGRAGHGAI